MGLPTEAAEALKPTAARRRLGGRISLAVWAIAAVISAVLWVLFFIYVI